MTLTLEQLSNEQLVDLKLKIESQINMNKTYLGHAECGKESFLIKKITAMLKLSEKEFKVSQSGCDFINEQITASATTFVLKRTIATRELTYIAPRPTFLDWLLRRERIIKCEADIHELRPYQMSDKVVCCDIKKSEQ